MGVRLWQPVSGQWSVTEDTEKGKPACKGAWHIDVKHTARTYSFKVQVD